jgi:hypothetical protein
MLPPEGLPGIITLSPEPGTPDEDQLEARFQFELVLPVHVLVPAKEICAKMSDNIVIRVFIGFDLF